MIFYPYNAGNNSRSKYVIHTTYKSNILKFYKNLFDVNVHRTKLILDQNCHLKRFSRSSVRNITITFFFVTGIKRNYVCLFLLMKVQWNILHSVKFSTLIIIDSVCKN